MMQIHAKNLFVVILLLSMLCAMQVGAEDLPCSKDQSLRSCFEGLHTKLQETLKAEGDKAEAEATAAASAETDQEVRQKSTADALSTDGSALNDALSNFAAAAGAQDGEGGSLFAFDQKLFEIGLDCEKSADRDDGSSERECSRTIPIRLKAEAVEAEVLEALKEAIPEDIREERVATLEKDLDSFDSIDVQLRASLEDANGNFRWGRNAKHYQDIFDGFYQSVIDAGKEKTTATEKLLDWQAEMNRWLGALKLGNVRFMDITIQELEETIKKNLSEGPVADCEAECEAKKRQHFADKADCEALRSRLSSLADSDIDRARLADCHRLDVRPVPPSSCVRSCQALAESQVERKIEEGQILLSATVAELFEARQKNWQALTKGKMSELATLIDNQPQAYLEINRKERGELSGPDETSAKLVFEFGLVNVNGLQKWASKNKSKSGDCKAWDENEKSLGCLAGFLKAKGGNLGDANRFAFSIERVEVDDFAFALPNDGVDFRLDAVDKTIGSLSYGRRLSFDGEGSEVARLDLSVSHEDVSDDPDRQDRTLAELTITRKLIGDFSLSVGVKWANKSEYLVDDDGEEIGGRIAFGWKVGKKDEVVASGNR